MKTCTRSFSGHVRGLPNLIISMGLFLSLIMMGACGSHGTSGDGSGGISFAIENPSAQSRAGASQAALFDCTRHDIESVTACVQDAEGVIVATGGPWPCNTGEATLDNVPEGQNYTVIVSLINSSGTVVFQGSVSEVTVVAGYTTNAGSISLSYANRAPVLQVASTVVHAARGSITYFDISATDADGDNLTFDIGNYPKDIWSPYNYITGVGFSAATSANTYTFSWSVPTDIQRTEYPVLFRVTDDGLPRMTTTQVVAIQVYDSSPGEMAYPPILDPISLPAALSINVPVQFALATTDRNTSPLSYTYSAQAISGTSSGITASFTPATGQFDWTPGAEGNYWLRFRVAFGFDGADLSDYEDVLLTVGDINRPPRLDPLGKKKLQYNVAHQFVVTAMDPEFDPITYEAFYIPATTGSPQPVSDIIGASFDPATQVFRWTPNEGQIGDTVTVRFRATDDSGAYHYEDVEISVVNE